MSRTIKHPYLSRKFVMKRYYSMKSTHNSSNALKYFTRRNNRARTKISLRKLIVNPEYADKVIFNKYHRQEEPWRWF